MKIFVLAFAFVLSIPLAQAAEVQPEGPKVAGVNETVVISFKETVWTREIIGRGYYQGVFQEYMVPVTREAFKTLAKLNKASKYECVIKASTFVPKASGPENRAPGGTYYIQDLNCD